MTPLVINHDARVRLYCGPAAIAALTGRPTSDVLRAVRKGRVEGGLGGKRTGAGRVAWMIFAEVAPALCELGFQSVAECPRPRPTLARFLRAYDGAPTVLLCGDHFIALRGWQWTDNLTRRVQSLYSLSHRRRLVFGHVRLC